MWNALAVLLVATSLGPARSSSLVTNRQPTWSPDGKWIAFASDRGGHFDIWKTDGVHYRRVVQRGADPAWSRDGKSIAFVAADDRFSVGIDVIDATGRTASRRRIVRGGFDPTWSPDGRRIAYAAATGGCDRGIGIWITRVADGLHGLLVESPDEFTDYVDPAWSPDGKRIAYAIPDSDQSSMGFALADVGETTYGGENVLADGFEPSWSHDGKRIVFVRPIKDGFGALYILELKTLRERRLTTLRAANPAWSPGGKRIAFAVRATDGSTDIYLIDADGTHLRRLTRQPPPSGPPETAHEFTDVDNRDPDWSPDGRRIAFVTSTWRPPRQPTPPAISVIGADGKARRTLTIGYSPSWAPDGKRLAYARADNDGATLEIVDADTKRSTRLFRTTQREYPVLEPDWSPDGTRIAFNDLQGGPYAIYVVPASGGVPSLLVERGHDPDWSPDGSRIVFVGFDSTGNRNYLEVANSDGTGRRQVIGSDRPFATPTWSPDGRRIAYQSYVAQRTTIEVIDADGTGNRLLAYGTRPSWAPDGSMIVYEAPVGGHSEVVTIPATGGTVKRVTYGGCTVVGTDFADRLAGTPGDDVICAFAGRDTIDGGAGEDRLLGGNGADLLVGGAGRDAIFGEDGGDTIRALDGRRDVVDGGKGVDCVTADARDSVVSVERRGCGR